MYCLNCLKEVEHKRNIMNDYVCEECGYRYDYLPKKPKKNSEVLNKLNEIEEILKSHVDFTAYHLGRIEGMLDSMKEK